jgi:hypothetical protein
MPSAAASRATSFSAASRMTCCCSAEVPGTDDASSTPLQNCTSLRGSDGAPVMLVMLARTAATSGCAHSHTTW